MRKCGCDDREFCSQCDSALYEMAQKKVAREPESVLTRLPQETIDRILNPEEHQVRMLAKLRKEIRLLRAVARAAKSYTTPVSMSKFTQREAHEEADRRYDKLQMAVNKYEKWRKK